MKFLEKLFGRKPASAPPPTATTNGKSTSRDNELIKVFDAYGRELQITRKDWRDNVLLGTLQQHRNDPDQLYSMLAQSLEDGFHEEALPFAKHLQTIDPIPSRAATLVGVIYLELNQLDEAERTFRTYIKTHGEEAYVLANLAKVYAKRGNTAQADTTLWRSLELDPNQENALGWFWAIANERGGEEGRDALEKLAALPGSWRARLWIAREQLEQKQVAAALRTYDEAIARAPSPIPTDLLMQMSGDLGNNGQFVELLKRVTPLFDVQVHGLQVGNNLIKANVELGRFDHARAMVDQLYGLNRPDYQPTLSFWDAEIAKARVAAESEQLITPPKVTMLLFQGPIWLAPDSPAKSLFPTKKPDAVVVCILGSTAETGATEVQLQMADTAGRTARAAPLFLSEQIHLRTNAISQVLQPWIPPGSFMLSGQPWDTETAIDQAKACQPASDYVVLTHVATTSRPFQVSFRLLRCIDGSLLDSAAFPLEPEDLEPAFTSMAERLLASLSRDASVDMIRPPIDYQIPPGPWFSDYQLRLEQALAIRAGAMGDTRRDFLSGEREIIGGMLHHCLSHPANVSPRIMLYDSLRRMKLINAQVVDEFRDKLKLLQKQHPAPEFSRQALDKMLGEIDAP